ncbi:MAG: hypothetical protein QM681_12120 [Novosphingobium sp.]
MNNAMTSASRYLTRFIARSIAFIGAGIATPLVANAASAQSCPADGNAAPAALHREWILKGWEKHHGDPLFDFGKKLGHFYDWSGETLILYDDMAPDHEVAHSAERYGELFTPLFRQQREVRHAVIDGPDAIVDGRLAVSTLEFAARLVGPDGTVMGIRDRSTLTWRCRDDGWKIVREHNSSHGVSREEIDRLVPHEN